LNFNFLRSKKFALLGQHPFWLLSHGLQEKNHKNASVFLLSEHNFRVLVLLKRVNGRNVGIIFIKANKKFVRGFFLTLIRMTKDEKVLAIFKGLLL
jgi:hypothetical protein